ncbi:MAG: inositol monophosphatase [Candidatus Nanohaloarchaea archaeon]
MKVGSKEIKVIHETLEEVGEFLRKDFRNKKSNHDYQKSDVKSSADRRAEEIIVEKLKENFPEHGILSEESGEILGAEYQWIVDPLDGTNNFVCSIPYYSTCLALVDSNQNCIFSAINIPETRQIFTARSEEGAFMNKEKLDVSKQQSLSRGTVSFVIGHDVKADSEDLKKSRQIEEAIASNSKRVLNTWCPSIDWTLVSRGEIEALFCYKPDNEEFFSGYNLAEEAGCYLYESEYCVIASQDKEIVEELKDKTEHLI